VCDLETSIIGAPYIYIYIYDISRLRVKSLDFFLEKWPGSGVGHPHHQAPSLRMRGVVHRLSSVPLLAC